MKLSEVIEQLQTIKEKHGDLELIMDVWAPSFDCNEEFKITEIGVQVSRDTNQAFVGNRI